MPTIFEMLINALGVPGPGPIPTLWLPTDMGPMSPQAQMRS
jgi:hypothetical protein